jgi:hypothetical protein
MTTTTNPLTRFLDATPHKWQLALLMADAMQLGGAKVRAGDLFNALDTLDLALTRKHPDTATTPRERYEEATESLPCDCGGIWARLTNDDSNPTGWWHIESDHDRYTTRKCPAGTAGPRA